jgi:methylenetetrahydrofolate dehydrogenase (NADP+)/methenyltetrahydrofolate cyclohydrolase
MHLAARLLLGKEIGAPIRERVRRDVEELVAGGVRPGLAVVLVGDDPASQNYVAMKGKACAELGIREQTYRLPADTPEAELVSLVGRLNADKGFHGILVQLPLPAHIDPNRVILRLDPDKDVDGIHPQSLGRLMAGAPTFVPCTPAGIQQMLLRSGNDPGGKHVVICGRSNIVGKPLANLLMQKAPGANATVTICHTGTEGLDRLTREADILVAAMGSPRAISADMVREGAVVIDVGSSRVDDPSAKGGHRTVGDVDFEAVREKASAITPVPGGVGPMTITMLMVNTVSAARLASGRSAPA